MAIFLQIWTGGCNAKLVDLTNAGKKGKTCKVLNLGSNHSPEQANFICHTLPSYLSPPDAEQAKRGGIVVGMEYEALARVMRGGAAAFVGMTYHEEDTMKGVDAPKTTLSVEKAKFRVTVDSSGVCIRDLTDKYNEPTAITTRQKPSAAYQKASKVWEQVRSAETFSEAQSVLSAAGCKLHSYCAMD
jgi:hypothetical protein